MEENKKNCCKEEISEGKNCCNHGVCPCCPCCICICTKELAKVLSPEAKKLLKGLV